MSKSFTKKSYHQVFVLSNISTLYCLILLPSCRPFRGLFRSIVHLNSFLRIKNLSSLVKGGSLIVSSVFVIITIFGLQLPHVFRRCFRIVDGNLAQCFLQKGHGLFGDFAKIFERVVLKDLVEVIKFQPEVGC